MLSAKDKDDIAMLRERLIAHFAGALEEVEIDVPWAAQKVAHLIHERTTVLVEEHGDTGTHFVVRAPGRTIEALREQLATLTAAS